MGVCWGIWFEVLVVFFFFFFSKPTTLFPKDALMSIIHWDSQDGDEQQSLQILSYTHTHYNTYAFYCSISIPFLFTLYSLLFTLYQQCYNAFVFIYSFSTQQLSLHCCHNLPSYQLYTLTYIRETTII